MSGTAATDTEERIRWGHSALTVELAPATDGSLRIVRFGPPGSPRVPLPQATPVVEVLAGGHGSTWSGRRSIDTAVGGRLRLSGYASERAGDRHRLRIRLADDAGGVAAELLLDSFEGLPVVRAHVDIINVGTDTLTVLAVSSLTLGGLPSPDDLDLHWADNDWLAECRWHRQPLRTHLPDLHRAAHEHDSRGCVGFSSRGSWTTDGHLAMGALTHRADGRCWMWQIETAAGWSWESGEREKGTYLALHGPTDAEHQWRRRLLPGARLRTEPAALAVTDDGFDGTLAALTAYRRRIRRPHRDHHTLPVVFNDYMNTLSGDPTTAKLLPLVDAAAGAGAEYFVVDSGWYDDARTGWWDSVGTWEPAASRFPGPRGIHEVFDRIRHHGMVPGLWLEPEVVGVRSPLAGKLPEEAFFRRNGLRIREHSRYQLDMRHPAATEHLDETVDRIVGEWGIGYLKLDYNISLPHGTDGNGADSPGDGLLEHTRAYLDWLGSVLDRYPDLVIENCASGGMRMDGAMLRVAQVQSTSDQQDHHRYPPITAAAPTAVPPEQAAVWAYAQPEFTTDQNAFLLTGALLGRVHLSGHLDRMSDAQLGLVRDAMDVYKRIRRDLPRAVPFWPLGLPGWTDPWLALGMRAGRTTYVTVWHREGEPAETALPIAHLRGHAAEVDILHPTKAPGSATWTPDPGELTVALPRTPTALLLRLRTNP